MSQEQKKDIPELNEVILKIKQHQNLTFEEELLYLVHIDGIAENEARYLLNENAFEEDMALLIEQMNNKEIIEQVIQKIHTREKLIHYELLIYLTEVSGYTEPQANYILAKYYSTYKKTMFSSYRMV